MNWVTLHWNLFKVQNQLLSKVYGNFRFFLIQVWMFSSPFCIMTEFYYDFRIFKISFQEHVSRIFRTYLNSRHLLISFWRCKTSYSRFWSWRCSTSTRCFAWKSYYSSDTINSKKQTHNQCIEPEKRNNYFREQEQLWFWILQRGPNDLTQCTLYYEYTSLAMISVSQTGWMEPCFTVCVSMTSLGLPHASGPSLSSTVCEQGD